MTRRGTGVSALMFTMEHSTSKVYVRLSLPTSLIALAANTCAGRETATAAAEIEEACRSLRGWWHTSNAACPVIQNLPRRRENAVIDG